MSQKKYTDKHITQFGNLIIYIFDIPTLKTTTRKAFVGQDWFSYDKSTISCRCLYTHIDAN